MDRRHMLQRLAAVTAGAVLPGIARAKVDGVTASRLRIGMSLPLSGMSGGTGLELQRGALAAFGQANRNGGVYGREIEAVTLDDGYDPPRTVANTRDLIGRGVFALANYHGTPTTVAALPLIKEADIPLIAPFTGSSLLRSASLPQVFNIRASYMQEGGPIVSHLVRYGGEQPRIGLFVQDDLYGQSVEASIIAALLARGLAPVAIARIPRGSSDVGPALKLFLNAGVTAVAMGSTYEPSSQLVKQLRQAGSTAVMASVSFVGTSNLTKRLTDSAHVEVNQVMPFPKSGTRRIVREYQAAMTAAGFTDFTYESMEGFCGAVTVLMGLGLCGPYPTRAGLMVSLEGTHDLGDFFLRFKRGDHAGSSFTEMVDVGPNGQFVR